MVYTNDKGPGSMSHLFVLERMTAHIIMRGQIKFATRLPVLCSVLLFLIRIIKQRFEGHNSFSLLVCVLSEAKEMEKIMKKMIKDYKGWILISNLIILFPIMIGIIMWNKLPDKMPLHFNANGKADSFCDKWVGAFVVPLVPLVLHWIIILMCATDKKIKAGMPVGRKIFVAILLFVPIISVYAALQEYSFVFNYKISSGRLALAMLGLVYVVLGNYIPKIKQNNTVGVRLP